MFGDSNVAQPIQQDISLVVGKNPNVLSTAVKSRSKVLGRALSFEFQGHANVQRRSIDQFVPPVHDLAEVARAANVEPYVDQSIRKHREMILKEGYSVDGADEEMVRYIKDRLFDMALVTQIPTENWIRECITNLVKFHNSFLVLRRDITRSRGRKIRMYGRTLDPIAGIFTLDPTTMRVKVDRYGTPKKWQQIIYSGGAQNKTEKKFNPEDIIHTTLDKSTGFSFGTPYIVPVLDDVRALRRLEELAVILASKEVFPLYHYKIGTDNLPAQQLEGGLDEVELVKAEVQNLPLQGNLITSHRHEVSLVSRDGAALDIGPFLEYFESRVMGGLRLSPLDLGRGGTANRACYSGDTETLTDKGWKNHWDIDVDNDMIATLNPDTKQIEFHKAASKHVYPYSGKMFHFHSRTSDVLVTPDHDMWVCDSTGGVPKFKKRKAELVTGGFKFQVQAEWKDQGQEITPVKLGSHPEIPADTWLRFLAFFIMYGKVTPSKNEMKLIVRSRPVSDTIKTFIAALPFKFRVYDNEDYTKFAVNDVDLVSHLSMACSCRQYPKRIPSYVIHADTDSLKLFLDELVPKDPLGETAIFYARTNNLAGQVQEIAFKLGNSSKVLADAKRPRVLISEGATFDEMTVGDNVSQVEYEGDVYCFNVPNHLFITRRNGKIAIQGNTASNINKNVQDAAKDYQQSFSTAISYGLFLPLLLEGGFNVTDENMVFLNFPEIDREELRAQQNHGNQLMLSNAIDCDEFRKDYLGKAPMADEQKKLTVREMDAEVDERLTRVAAAVKPTPASGSSSSSTAKKSTSTARKTASNKGQPRNQSGTKSAKTRSKANDYVASVRGCFDSFKPGVLALMEVDQDELSVDELKKQIDIAFSNFLDTLMKIAKDHIPYHVDCGVEDALSQLNDQEDDLTVGRRALERFMINYVKVSFEKALTPYKDNIYSYITVDQDGNDTRYMTYGAMSSLASSIHRLAKDQITTATRFGFAKASRTLGYTSMVMEAAESGERKTIELNKGPIVYKNLTPDLEDTCNELILGSKLIQDTSEEQDIV